ncbi:hypothetical protein J2Z60_001076 [Lactobacillus colini]|uniref:Cyanophage baseplate Pam3 plug gp18 domain-containing protein n=1 Tax=Lactobacillus colini TaxID=1819254 RepID=A0ABS4MEY5_9LACO|nr:hypothetical protein [Lactobacillus colini]MBP2057901.1 hypothetical protein [Lactobacillus colini]
MRNYVPVDVNNLPDIFDIQLAGEIYTFRIDYNQVANYYTVTILKDDVTLLSQEPLLLNQLVGIDLQNSNLPSIDLRVMDETGKAQDAGLGELGEGNVQIYLDVIDPNGSETDDPTIKPLGYDPDETSDELTDEEVSL